MGLSNSKADNEAAGKQLIGRLPAVGEATRKTKGGASALPPNAKLADQKDWAVIQVDKYDLPYVCAPFRNEVSPASSG